MVTAIPHTQSKPVMSIINEVEQNKAILKDHLEVSTYNINNILNKNSAGIIDFLINLIIRPKTPTLPPKLSYFVCRIFVFSDKTWHFIDTGVRVGGSFLRWRKEGKRFTTLRKILQKWDYYNTQVVFFSVNLIKLLVSYCRYFEGILKISCNSA